MSRATASVSSRTVPQGQAATFTTQSYCTRKPRNMASPNSSDPKKGVMWSTTSVPGTTAPPLTHPCPRLHQTRQDRQEDRRPGPPLHLPRVHFHHRISSMPRDHMSQGGLAQPRGSTQKRHLQPKYMKTSYNLQYPRKFPAQIQRLKILSHEA